MISLLNKTVVVTGGALRLGRAIALACAEVGANVVITYNRSQNEAEQTVAKLQQKFPNAKFAAYNLEVSRAVEVETLKNRVLENFGRVDALVNNAAIFRRTPWEELTEADFDDHVNANLKGPYLLSKKFGDLFLAQGSGAILNIADIYGLRPLKNYVPYCVSKAGLVMLTEATAKALAPHVRVNCICPGTILTPSETQNENGEDEESPDAEAALVARIPMQRLGTPKEIAQTALFLLAGPQFISGAILPVDGAQRLK